MSQETREIIFADGSVAYAAKGHSFSLQAADGGEIEVVSERHLGNLNDNQVAKLCEDNRFVKGEYRKKGGWRVVPKTLGGMVDEGIITPKEAEDLARRGLGRPDVK